MSRTLPSFILIPLLVACPLFCGAADVGVCAHLDRLLSLGGDADEASTSASDCCSEEAPGGVPGEGDHCLCEGAVTLEASRIADGDPDEFLGFLGSPALPVLPDFLSPHLDATSSDFRAASFPWGHLSASHARAVLQSFQC